MLAVGRSPGSYGARHENCKAGQTSVDCEQSMQEAVSREIISITQIDRHNVCCSNNTRDLRVSPVRDKHYTSRLLVRIQIPFICLAPCLLAIRLDDVLLDHGVNNSTSTQALGTYPMARYDAVEVPIRHRLHVALHRPVQSTYFISNMRLI